MACRRIKTDAAMDCAHPVAAAMRTSHMDLGIASAGEAMQTDTTMPKTRKECNPACPGSWAGPMACGLCEKGDNMEKQKREYAANYCKKQEKRKAIAGWLRSNGFKVKQVEKELGCCIITVSGDYAEKKFRDRLLNLGVPEELLAKENKNMKLKHAKRKYNQSYRESWKEKNKKHIERQIELKKWFDERNITMVHVANEIGFTGKRLSIRTFQMKTMEKDKRDRLIALGVPGELLPDEKAKNGFAAPQWPNPEASIACKV